MDGLMIIATLLYTIIGISLLLNLLQMFLESKKLKEEGKTPLMGRNIFTVLLAAAAEVLAVMLVIYLHEALEIPMTVVMVISTFSIAYVLRNGAAYLVAWGLWAFLLQGDKKKLRKATEEDQKGAI